MKVCVNCSPRCYIPSFVDFLGTIEACDLKVGSCRQLIDFMKVCEYLKVKVISLPYISRFCMFCALLGQDIR